MRRSKFDLLYLNVCILCSLLALTLCDHGWQQEVDYQFSSANGLQKTVAQVIAPRRVLSCNEGDNPCRITLNVSAMKTMTFYEYYDDGHRSSRGFEARLENGSRLALANVLDRPISRFLHPLLADGFRRTVYAVNDQLPGPVITAYPAQNMEITVLNNIPQPVTMHWHGQHARGTPWADGMASITQCSIQPGDSYVYRFSADQAGTHWYHAHHAGERSDGVYGGFIVKERTSREYIDRPEDHTMILTDWFDDVWNVTFHQFQHGTFPDLVNSRIAYSPLQLADGTLGSHYPFVSGLINGRGHRYHPNADNCSVLVNTPLSEFVISNEGSFRLRIIVASAWHPFRISIQGHKLRVVATDGEDITTNRTASEVDYVIVQSGERYDVVPVSMEASPSGAYWIVAETVEDDKDIISRSYCLRGHRAYGTLRYGNDTTENPATWYDPLDRGCISDSKCYVVNCPFKSYPHSYNLTCINVDQFEAVNPVGMTPDSNMKSAFFNFQSLTVHQVTTNGINGRRYMSTPVPLLTQLEDVPSSWEFCEYPTGMHETRGKQCTHTYTLTSTITEMVLMNLGNAGSSSGGGHSHGKRSTHGHGGDGSHGHGDGAHVHGHPFHLHGYHFRVLKIGYPTYHHGVYMADNTDINCSDAFCEKGHIWNNRPNVTFNPLMPKKDSIFVPPGGYVLVRIERNNPGFWSLHCHLAPHQEQGMNIVIVDKSNSINAPSTIPRCTVGDSGSKGFAANHMNMLLFTLLVTLSLAFCVLQ